MAEATIVEKTCECGSPFTVDLTTVKPKWRDFLLRHSNFCAPCCERQRAEREAEERREAEAERGARVQRRIDSSGLPAGLGADLPTGAGAAREAARDWAAGRGPTILVLAGPVGVGKTTLAAAAFRHHLARRAGYWRSVPVLFAHLSAGFGTPTHDQAVALLDGSYLLALDDLDKSRPTEYAAERLFAAIDGCYANRTPLVVTTNLSIGELVAHWPDPFGAAIGSRLTDRTVSRVVRMEGDDRRQARRTAA